LIVIVECVVSVLHCPFPRAGFLDTVHERAAGGWWRHVQPRARGHGGGGPARGGAGRRVPHRGRVLRQQHAPNVR